MKKKMFFWVLSALILSTGLLLAENNVIVLTIDGGIGPATSYYIQNAMRECEKSKCKALVIKLNTPGGLLDATREITGEILDSKIPVIVYVAPGGARAGSAGVFITLSAHVAAMAPGTNIGAAHPVGIDGSSDTTVLGQKVENDAAAYARSIAQKRNRNVDWAEQSVRNSISASENEALVSNVIDFVANDLNSLFDQLKDKRIFVEGAEIELDLTNSKIIYREMNLKEQLLTFISNPNILYIFIMLGIYGVFFELKSPGSILPGVVGTVSILFAAYSLQMLPINYVGLGLIVLAFVMFVLEIFVISYGFLTVGGVVSLAVGSIILIDSPLEFMRISMSLIISLTLITGILAGLVIYYGIKAQKIKNSTGKFTIIGQIGIAKTDISKDKNGKVLINGEIWQAISDEKIDKGNQIIASDVNSMIVRVSKYVS